VPRRNHGAAALLLEYEREAMHELCKQSPRRAWGRSGYQ
jgi:hypothetical protein